MAPRESLSIYLSLSISLSRRIAISWDIPRYLMLFMFYPSECIPAISKFCPKYAQGKKDKTMEKIEACVFQISPAVPAHLGRSCPSHLEFLLQLRHTSWGWQVFGWLPEFTCETSLGQQQAHCMICMVSCHNIPKWDGRTKTAQSSHQQQANLTSKDFFQWQIRSCRMPLAARKHLGRLVLLSCQCIPLLLQFGFWRAFDDEDNEHTIWGSGKHLWDARFYWNKETARNSIVPSACEKKSPPGQTFSHPVSRPAALCFRNAVLQLLFLKAGCALFQMRKKCMRAKGGLEELSWTCRDLPTGGTFKEPTMNL